MTAAQIIRLAPVSGTWLGAASTAVLLLVAAGMYIARHHPVTALWVLVLWHTRRVHALHYHRHGRRHGRPPMPRCRRTVRRLLSVRLRATATPQLPAPGPADTVPIAAITTLPDIRIRQFARHA